MNRYCVILAWVVFNVHVVAADPAEFATLDEYDDRIVALSTILAHRDYAELEALADYLRTEKSRHISGEWRLRSFYVELRPAWEKNHGEDQEAWLEFLADWKRAFPESATPRTALAEARVHWAWEARSSVWSRSVNDKQWEGFEEQLSLARPEMRQAEREATIDDPAFYDYAIWIGLGSSWEKENLYKLMARGVSIDPDYYSLYFAMAVALLPKWGGSVGQVEQFAERMADFREEKGDELYARILSELAHQTKSEEHAHRFRFSWPRMKRGYEAILAAYPKTQYHLNQFCRYACIYGDRETAVELFERIGEEHYAYVWKKNEFNKWRAWALEGAESPLMPPLYWAIRNSDIPGIERELNRGADINARAYYNHTPLFTAVSYQQPKAAAYLLEQGADPNLGTRSYSPAAEAARKNDPEILSILLKAGADPAAVGRHGWSCLHLAVRSDSVEMVEMLLAYPGVDPNTTGYNEKTPLHAAAHNDNPELVLMLLNAGADPSALDIGGYTPLGIAEHYEFDEVAEILRNYQKESSR